MGLPLIKRAITVAIIRSKLNRIFIKEKVNNLNKGKVRKKQHANVLLLL